MAGAGPARREWRALSVRQPFASLIVVGAKRYEGRSWRPATLGPVLIHASGALDPSVKLAPVQRALTRAGLEASDLPRGQIIGMVNVVAVLSGADAMRTVPKAQRWLVDAEDGEVWHVPWLWQLSDPVPLPHVVVKGALNLWRVPADVIRKLTNDLP